ncbi:MAG: hypothetical protein WDW38_002630 [Sanguina aurantia]
MFQTMGGMAERLLLGLGARSTMFPQSLEDFHNASADEQPFRVAL